MKSLKDSINETILSRKFSDPKLLVIKEWLEEYGIENYSINSDYEIDVDGDVIIGSNSIKEFPSYIQFGIVQGHFLCGN